jgi:lysyl-tRNA synthetase class 2
VLKRPSSRRKSSTEGITLNLVPILDTMVTLIGFMLFTMSFLALVTIESPFPEASSKVLEQKLKELSVDYDPKGWNDARAIDTLWKYCRKKLGGPGFLVNVPKKMSPLAKSSPTDPFIVERFQPIIAGSEVGNGYSELNDPIDQRARFTEQQAMRDAGDKEAQMADWEYVEALEHGMPPTCGFGVSERLFSFLAGKPIREAQTFPLMRPRI